MCDLNEYLDMAKAKSGSDYRTAKALGVTRATISNVRAGRGMSDDLALGLADYLQIDPLCVIAAAAATRTKSPALRARWEELARRAVAVIFLAVAVGYGATTAKPAHAAEMRGNIHYAHVWAYVVGGAYLSAA